MDLLSNSGIYKILNSVTGKYYIGSATCIRKRWNVHLTHLRRGTHHSTHLQRAFNKYGEAAFSIIVLECVDKGELQAREQEYLDKLKLFNRTAGYNVCFDARSCRGVKRSAKTRRRIAKAKLGKSPWNAGKNRPPFSDKWLENMSIAQRGANNSFFGKTHTAPARKKISERMKERMSDPQANYFYQRPLRGASNGMFGRTHSAESRAKIGTASRGRKHSLEARRSMSKHRKGRPLLKNR